MPEQVAGRAALDNLPLAEHEELVGDHPRAEQVMGDVEQAQAALAAVLGEQAGPQRHVQHRNGLVGEGPAQAGRQDYDACPLCRPTPTLAGLRGRAQAPS
jgi:hypothetical protein